MKHAIEIGVVVAVAPSLLAEATVQPIFEKHYAAKVELTYQDIMRGSEEPDLIFVQDIEHYRRMVKLINKINAGLKSGRYHWETVSDGPTSVSA